MSQAVSRPPKSSEHSRINAATDETAELEARAARHQKDT